VLVPWPLARSWRGGGDWAGRLRSGRCNIRNANIAHNHGHDAAAQERLAFARQCLIEANRTLDPEVAVMLRKLAVRYFDEARGDKAE
jgi:hypothetical protein